MLTTVEILNPIEVRVLGALLEKDMATPEYYPMTVNSLQNECNQKSSREPVTNFAAEQVESALESLQYKGLVTHISGAGHRVEKYGHRLGEKLNLGRRELALLCILMLRGAQTVGELRGRSERLHDFVDMEEVERVLESLQQLEEPLVAPAARGRWVHLLGGAVADVPEPTQHRLQLVPHPLEDRVAKLEGELAQIKEQLGSLLKQLE